MKCFHCCADADLIGLWDDGNHVCVPCDWKRDRLVELCGKMNMTSSTGKHGVCVFAGGALFPQWYGSLETVLTAIEAVYKTHLEETHVVQGAD